MEISNTFIYVSLTLWQIGFIIGILLRLFYRDDKKKKTKEVFTNRTTPKAVEVELPKQKKVGHIEIETKKNIMLQKPTNSSIKSDEVIKGKVVTQKEKLKQLRRG
jgi:beta-lactamase regulating signal transducer with metallopeptidase domain